MSPGKQKEAEQREWAWVGLALLCGATSGRPPPSLGLGPTLPRALFLDSCHSSACREPSGNSTRPTGASLS